MFYLTIKRCYHLHTWGVTMLINLKKLREDASISQKALADAIGVSQQSVNKYENHNIEPDIETLIRIADFFETSVDYLIGHTSVRRKIEEVHVFELNDRESKVMEQYRSLTSKQKACVNVVMDSYSE